MFERFTERARQVLVFAQEEARILKHDYIGTEHILLGLLRQKESLSARVLASRAITVERVRAEVVRIVGTGEELVSGQIPFTPRAKKVLERALREALSLSDDDIATYHILLGLLSERGGVAARVLRDFEVEAQDLREQVLAERHDAPDEGSPPWDYAARELPRERLPAAEVLDRLRQLAESEASGLAPTATGMFARFTERARQVVARAQEEARHLNHDYIGTEHLLLGLLGEADGIGAWALSSLGITHADARAGVISRVGSGQEAVSGQVLFRPHAKKVLELALREALSLGHNYIGTEHILLALVRENEGVAARILLDFDADSEKIRNAVIRMLSGPRRRQRSGGQGGEQPGHGAASSRDVDVRRLGELADEELEALIRQLTEREREVSDERRILHGKLDILRAEQVNRRRRRDDTES